MDGAGGRVGGRASSLFSPSLRAAMMFGGGLVLGRGSCRWWWWWWGQPWPLTLVHTQPYLLDYGLGLAWIWPVSSFGSRPGSSLDLAHIFCWILNWISLSAIHAYLWPTTANCRLLLPPLLLLPPDWVDLPVLVGGGWHDNRKAVQHPILLLDTLCYPTIIYYYYIPDYLLVYSSTSASTSSHTSAIRSASTY